MRSAASSCTRLRLDYPSHTERDADLGSNTTPLALSCEGAASMVCVQPCLPHDGRLLPADGEGPQPSEGGEEAEEGSHEGSPRSQVRGRPTLQSRGAVATTVPPRFVLPFCFPACVKHYRSLSYTSLAPHPPPPPEAVRGAGRGGRAVQPLPAPQLRRVLPLEDAARAQRLAGAPAWPPAPPNPCPPAGMLGMRAVGVACNAWAYCSHRCISPHPPCPPTAAAAARCRPTCARRRRRPASPTAPPCWRSRRSPC